jgi:hypothetical protein
MCIRAADTGATFILNMKKNHPYMIQVNHILRILAINIHLRGPITHRPPDFGLGTEPELNHISRENLAAEPELF